MDVDYSWGAQWHSYLIAIVGFGGIFLIIAAGIWSASHPDPILHGKLLEIKSYSWHGTSYSGLLVEMDSGGRVVIPDVSEEQILFVKPGRGVYVQGGRLARFE